MSRLVVGLALLLSLFAAPAFAEDAASTAPFRAKLVSNVVIARKGATSLGAFAKHAPPKTLSADEKKAWSDQSKAFATGAARLSALRVRMDAVLAKTNAPASELAQINLELANAHQEIETESQRCAVGAATKSRHESAMKSMR